MIETDVFKKTTGTGWWMVKEEGTKKPMEVLSVKREAVQAGRKAANSHRSSRLVMHGLDEALAT